MLFKEFVKEMEREVSLLAEGVATVESCEVPKGNGVARLGLAIRFGDDSLGTTQYLEYYFKKYRQGCSLKELAEELFLCAKEARKGFSDDTEKMLSDVFRNYENMKDSIFPCLINAEWNAEFLKSVPHEIVEDLAVIYRLRMVDSDGVLMSILIQNKHIEFWHDRGIYVTPQMLKAVAFENLKNDGDATVEAVDELMAEELGCSVDELYGGEEHEGCGMIVVTNKHQWYGASVILDEKTLKNLSDELGSDLYILPSSVHECIVVPYEGDADLNFLKAMVYMVNKDELPVEKRLSDNVYLYERSSNSIKIA